MKYVKFQLKNDPKNNAYGKVKKNIVYELKNSCFTNDEENGRTHDIDSVKLLPPVTPTKIVGLGYNYKDLVGEKAKYDEPIIFLKPTSALIGHNDSITIHKSMTKVWAEVELCIVIGKTAKNVSRSIADDYIMGYTIGNDVTTTNILNRDHHLARSKGWDTFCPIGPWIETDVNTNNLKLTNRINGTVFQESNTNMRIFDDKTIVSHLSKIMTLNPGDIIMTGTPQNAENSILNDGDEVKVCIENIGELSNKIKLIN
jgi:2-keto-4-pentenoate hydratase/2-oxohepta-3-ene-1,7-dioic acid hydratase in catechol pathway